MKIPDFIRFNRPAAAAVLTVVVLAGVPLGAVRSVHALERRVETAYTDGSSKYGTPKADLSKLAEYAEQLYSIASANGCDGEGTGSMKPHIDALRQSLASPIADTDALTPLMSAASLAYNRLLNDEALSDAQKNSAISYFYEMDSIRMRLQNNEEYAAAAQKYNGALRSFPASLFCGGMDDAITFGR